MAYLKKKNNWFDVINCIILALMGIITLYPFIYVLTISLIPAEVYLKGGLFLFPVRISFDAYRIVLSDKFVGSSFLSSVIITIGGTFCNLILTSMAAYALSKTYLKGYRFFMGMFIFTMYFSGGLIPSYLLMSSLKLVDTYWAVILTGGISTYYMLVMRSFYLNLPASMEEAALIDGASEVTVLLKIILPLSKPVIAALSLFFSVGHWNSYFTPMIYLNNRNKWPLQIVLREILFETIASIKGSMDDMGGIKETLTVAAPLRMATVIVSIIPITVVYPFLQKYFVKGVLIGAVKA
ncbi:MAG TPA: carbohydrate ABC transporter permease [Clostridiales bacterium]|nr:carbohydrate ABC transporter permease [Clostridiales bacterium]